MEQNAQDIDNEQIEKIELLETIEINNLLSDQVSTEKKQPVQKLKVKGSINFLEKTKADLLIDSIKNVRHKTVILIMMDCGLRVTECVSLQMKNFDFKRKILIVKTLKKRGETLNRQIPISNRLLLVLADYIKERKPTGENDYLFPSPKNKNTHITRKAINNVCEKLKHKHPSLHNLHPHALRHTFATRMLASGTELHDLKTMLGHSSYNTTLIYNHTPLELLRKNIDDATTKKEIPFIIWLKKIAGIKGQVPEIINYTTNPESFLIGRDKELLHVIDCLNKNINTILTGKIGIGKSHILKQVEFRERKILKLDELSNLKLTFVNMLLYLYDNDKQTLKELIFGGFDKTQISQKLQKDSIQSLIEEILKITEKHEYILMIDNVDGITTKGMKCIELLKDHFVILTTAREIPINKANFLWNFERIIVENLSRTQSLELIHRLSYDMDIEDFELYRNHIYDQSNGNPRVIYELCDRYRKEIIVTDDLIRSVRHIGGIPEIDMSFVVVILLAGVTVLRYTSREIGGTNMRFIGGLALVLLMLSRYFMARSRRRFI